MIIVIGASSFIGSYLVDELVAQGREVFATGHSNLNEAYYARRNVEMRPGRPGQARRPRKAAQGERRGGRADGQHDAQQRQLVYPPALHRHQYHGHAERAGVLPPQQGQEIIYGTSHKDVSKLWDCGRPITENDGPCFNHAASYAVYAISKLAAVDLVEHYHQAHGVTGVSIRLAAVYGFGPHMEIYDGGKAATPRITVFIRRAMAGEPIEIWGDPTKGQDITYVRDIVGRLRRGHRQHHGPRAVQPGLGPAHLARRRGPRHCRRLLAARPSLGGSLPAREAQHAVQLRLRYQQSETRPELHNSLSGP